MDLLLLVLGLARLVNSVKIIKDKIMVMMLSYITKGGFVAIIFMNLYIIINIIMAVLDILTLLPE